MYINIDWHWQYLAIGATLALYGFYCYIQGVKRSMRVMSNACVCAGFAKTIGELHHKLHEAVSRQRGG